jgi:hypothetical protein
MFALLGEGAPIVLSFERLRLLQPGVGTVGGQANLVRALEGKVPPTSLQRCGSKMFSAKIILPQFRWSGFSLSKWCLYFRASPAQNSSKPVGASPLNLT